MLELEDFFHVPQVDALAEQIAAEGPGLIVVAGVGARTAPPVADDRTAVRIPRQLRRRVCLLPVDLPYTYTEHIAETIRRRPDLLVIDRLNGETAQSALQAAQSGLQVPLQLDTIFKGADVVHHPSDLV